VILHNKQIAILSTALLCSRFLLDQMQPCLQVRHLLATLVNLNLKITLSGLKAFDPASFPCLVLDLFALGVRIYLQPEVRNLPALAVSNASGSSFFDLCY